MNITEPSNTQPYLQSKANFAGWFGEAIWGHRLQRQSASALLLEFLGMAEAMHREGSLFAPTTPSQNVAYQANRSLHLRSILFNNPTMEEIREECRGNDNDAWEKWLEDMRQRAAVGEAFTADFSFLRGRFETFGDLASRVALLKRIVMDPGTDRSWTEQLLFPIGPTALYEPLNASNLNSHRELFTRTGEIAYLMLSRASDELRVELGQKLVPLFSQDTTRNRLLTQLVPVNDPLGVAKSGTYLPYLKHPAYDRLAQDLVNLLSLGLPDQDVLEHFKNILAFNLYIFAIETSNHWMGKNCIPYCVCEIPGPRMDVVRKASIATRDENEGLGIQAVHRYAETMISSSPEVNEKLDSPNYANEEKADALANHLSSVASVDKGELKANSPDEVRKKFISLAESGFRDGTAEALQGLGRAAGLTDRRGTNKFRYAPTDKLLRTLVLANVTYQIEEDELLRILNVRYNLIIGPWEAEEQLPLNFRDKGDFAKNRERFSQHLTGLGLAQRMSDACTYIKNPYHQKR